MKLWWCGNETPGETPNIEYAIENNINCPFCYAFENKITEHQ